MIVLNNKSDWLEQNFKLHPEADALISKNNSISYSQLQNKVNSLAAALSTNGVTVNSHVAVVADNSPEFVIAILALWKLNAVPVPLNIRLTSMEIEKLYKLSDSSLLLKKQSLNSDYKFSDEVNSLPIVISEKGYHSNEFNSEFNPENRALLMYTSGTTGEPKGVILTFNNLYQSAGAFDSITDQTEQDIWLASLPFYHIGGFSIITRALLGGIPVAFPDSLKINDIKDAISKYKPTLASFVPTTLKRLIELKIQPGKLRRVFVGGGPVDKMIAADAIDNNWPIVKVYGSTETCSMIAAVTYNELKNDSGLGAKPLAENNIVILNNEFNRVPVNSKGQVAVKSKSVTCGYYKNETATNEKFFQDYYLTSDYGFINSNGYLFIEGRMDDIIISGGENINPKEIEEVLLKHPAVSETVVIKMKDEKWGEAPAAVVRIKSPAENTELIDFLNNHLSSFKVPKEIFIVQTIPKNEMGKVNKQKLREDLNIK